MAESLFLRLLPYEDKAAALAEAVAAVREGRTLNPSTELRAGPVVYAVDPASFRQVPGSPFAYWVSERIRRLFTELPPFEDESEGRTTRCGLGTLDDFRFLRLRWEVSLQTLRVFWVLYYHGGLYSPIYDEFPLVVRWGADGSEIKAFVEKKVGSASRKVQGEDHYFLPGFVFPRRTRAFSPKVMPAGGIYSTAGQAGFLSKGDLEWGLAVLSSGICNYLISLSQGTTSQEFGGTNPQYEVGLIKRLPWPTIDEAKKQRLAQLTRMIFEEKRSLASAIETSCNFTFPPLIKAAVNTIQDGIAGWQTRIAAAKRHLVECHELIDEIVREFYDLSPNDWETVKCELSTPSHTLDVDISSGDDSGDCIEVSDSLALNDSKALIVIRYPGV